VRLEEQVELRPPPVLPESVLPIFSTVLGSSRALPRFMQCPPSYSAATLCFLRPFLGSFLLVPVSFHFFSEMRQSFKFPLRPSFRLAGEVSVLQHPFIWWFLLCSLPIRPGSFLPWFRFRLSLAVVTGSLLILRPCHLVSRSLGYFVSELLRPSQAHSLLSH